MENELKAMVEEFIKKNEEWGFEEYLKITFEENKIYFTGEFDFEQGMSYTNKLDKVLQKYNSDWYFDAECPGRFVAYLN